MSDLRSIRTFDDLRRYLQDDLDWPLEDYAFEDITFSPTRRTNSACATRKP